MSKKILALIILLFSTYAYTAQAEIPKHFHGLWATQEGCRQINASGIDAPLLIVNKLELNLPFSLCQLVSIRKFDSQIFLGQYTCRREKDEIRMKLIEISLSDGPRLSVKNDNSLKNLSVCNIKNIGSDSFGPDDF